MAYAQGAVVAASDLLGNNATRPYVVVSTEEHPFHTEECIAVVVTTTERSEAVELTPATFAKGSLPRRSYASPWNPMTLKNTMITKQVATVRESTVREIGSLLDTYVV
jgi:mRNA interferase MazF